MMLKILRLFTVVAGSLVLLAVVWKHFSTSAANSLVDEGNAAVQSANDLTVKGGAKLKELLSDSNLNGFPETRAPMEEGAQAASDLLAQAAQSYRVAADKFRQAGEKIIDQEVAEYWKLKMQAFEKMAEAKEAYRKVALLVLDKSIERKEDLQQKLIAQGNAAQKLNAEQKELADRADKWETDHKSKFKQ